MAEKEERRSRYSDGFALTRYTMPVVMQMAEVIPGGFFIYREDEKRDLIYANKKVLEIYGCDTLDEFKALTGFTFQGMVHPEDFERIQQSIDEQIDDEAGDSMDHVDYRIISKDGSIKWVDDFGHYSYSPEYGDVYYVFINDITEQKAMQTEIKHDENDIARFRKDINEVLEKIDALHSTGDEKAISEGLGAIKEELEDIMKD